MTRGKAGFESSGAYGKKDALKSSLFSSLTIKLCEIFRLRTYLVDSGMLWLMRTLFQDKDDNHSDAAKD